MNRFLIFCILTLSTRGDQEHSPVLAKGDSLNKLLNDPSLSDLLNDPNLWLILKKRLETPVECAAVSRRNNSIIKTKDSLDAGASFIAAPTVQNDKECEKECCKEKLCNTAVLKTKGGRSEELACYLFDCKSPNLCVFTSHPGFTVLDFSYARDSDPRAHELDQLAMTSAGTLSSTTSATTTTTTTIATTSVTKMMRPQDNVRHKPADLFSECHQTSDCRDQNTDCLAGYCVCQQGFHVVEMQCRRDCNQELEFECNNKGNPLFSECIAVYDYCDGIAQCSDGSDESSCLDSSKHKEPDMSQGKLQSELTELSSTQSRGRVGYNDQSAALASNMRHDLQGAGSAVQDSTENRRQPVDTDAHHRLVSEETLKGNYENNRAPAADGGINEQNYRQTTANSGQVDGTPLKQKSNQGMLLDQNPRLREKTEQDNNNSLQDGVGHRISESASSYTDQLLAYGALPGGGKKFQNELDHSKYQFKTIQKEDSVNRDASASGFEGVSDTRNMLPARDENQPSAASRVMTGGETKDRPPVPVDQGRMEPDSRWSSNNRQLEDRIPDGKDMSEKSQPYRPVSESRHLSHQKVDEDGGQATDQRLLMKQNQDSGLPVQSHYGLSYMSGERPNVNVGDTRQETDGYRQTSDRSEMTYSDINIEKAKVAGNKPYLVKDEQEARRYRPLVGVGGSRHQLAGMSDDPRNHKPLMGLTSKDSSDMVKNEHGDYDAGGHMLQGTLPESNEYDKTGSKLMNALPDGYEQQGSKSADVLPERIGYERQAAKAANVSPDRSRYERLGSKSDVSLAHGTHERQGSKSSDVLPDHSRYERPRSKSGDILPDRSDYERQGSKAMDVVPEQSGYKRPGLKSSDEHVLYERPGSKLVDIVPDHDRYDRPGSKLLHPGGKDGIFHGKDHYNGGNSMYGTYDNGNYEDEVGNPNYGMWLKGEDQSNEPGYVDPRQGMIDSAEGYDRDGYAASRLQPEGAADVYGPDYVQYYYNGNNPGFVKTGRNYLHNGDYDDADPDVRMNGDHQMIQNTSASPVTEAQPSVHSISTTSLNPDASTAIPLPVKSSLSPDAAKSSLAGLSSTHHDLLSVQIKEEPQAPDVNTDVKEEKVERFFLRMETNRGAVVALILGIILTTALLILAGCRLRHFRKRYRKGRHLNSNEADYLINGMYL